MPSTSYRYKQITCLGETAELINKNSLKVFFTATWKTIWRFDSSFHALEKAIIVGGEYREWISAEDSYSTCFKEIQAAQRLTRYCGYCAVAWFSGLFCCCITKPLWECVSVYIHLCLELIEFAYATKHALIKGDLLCKNHFYKLFEHSCVAAVCENNQPIMLKIHQLILFQILPLFTSPRGKSPSH